MTPWLSVQNCKFSILTFLCLGIFQKRFDTNKKKNKEKKTNIEVKQQSALKPCYYFDISTARWCHNFAFRFGESMRFTLRTFYKRTRNASKSVSKQRRTKQTTRKWSNSFNWTRAERKLSRVSHCALEGFVYWLIEWVTGSFSRFLHFFPVKPLSEKSY